MPFGVAPSVTAAEKFGSRNLLSPQNTPGALGESYGLRRSTSPDCEICKFHASSSTAYIRLRSQIYAAQQGLIDNLSTSTKAPRSTFLSAVLKAVTGYQCWDRCS